MKELKIIAVLVFFTLLTYWGVEPFAHSVMHKHVDFKHFAYKDLPALTKTGDAARGKALVMGAGACVGCHSIKAAGIPSPMDANTAAASYGVNPPDLSHVGALFDEKFLAEMIKDPTKALMLGHKFDGKTRVFPMPAFAGAGGDKNQEVADMVAYLKSIATASKITPTIAYTVSCGRCHANRYAKWTQIGFVPKTKSNITTNQDIDLLKFETKVADYQNNLAKYLGKLPPDLSIMIRARSESFMKTFVEDPQSQLPGTAMPRVGLNKEGYENVKAFLEKTGDPSKPAREKIGPWVIGFFVIFTILALLWKRSIWKDLH
ncbi:MAG: c-type cytochrome [Sulfurospirillaceae bacterium]|nr:c-type cytochrome [Sulfurospirillaceae bacterium]